MQLTDDQRSVLRIAAQHGFSLLGIRPADTLSGDLAQLQAWTELGRGTDLGYMTRNPLERATPRTLQEGVRTVISLAIAYPAEGPPASPVGVPHGRIARYAWGLDYHDIVLPRLRAVAAALKADLGAGRARAACDHSPILERGFAARAGLGFIGKNTCLITPRRGSWSFLGEVLLDIDVPATATQATTDHCGTCTTCLDRCPTRAFPAPYVLDAARCISYLTIEARGPIPRPLRKGVGDWLFGCDVCQEVCPFNRFEAPEVWPELRADAGVGPFLALEELFTCRASAFEKRFAGTPLHRPGRSGLLRNALVVASNLRATSLVPSIEALLRNEEDPVIALHALGALALLAPERARACGPAAGAHPWVRGEWDALHVEGVL